MRRAWTSLTPLVPLAALLVTLASPASAPAVSLLKAGGVAHTPPLPTGCVDGPATGMQVQRSMDVDNVELDETVQVVPNVRIDRDLEPGDVITCTLVIRSRRGERATFQLEPYGVIGSKRANVQYEFVDEDDDRYEATAGAWLQPLVPEVTLDPREVVKVPVTVTVPDDPPTGSAFGSVNVSSRTRASGGDTVLGIETQAATIFLLRIGGEGSPDLRLRDVDAPRLRWDREPWPLTADLDNDGTLQATASGRVRVRSVFGSTVTTLPIRRATILPGGRVAVETRWKGVPWFGFYRYDVRVQNVAAFEGEDAPHSIATTSGWFVALPPWWVLAIIAAILLALAWRWWRGRRADAWDDGELDLEIEDHELGG